MPPSLLISSFALQCLLSLHIACGITDIATEDVGLLHLPCPLYTAIVVATACSSQCVCLVRLGLLLCPTCLAGVAGIGAWGYFLA